MWLKWFSVIGLSAVKFIGGVPLAKAYGLTWHEAWICAVIGGFLGVLVFVYFSKSLIFLWQSFTHKLVKPENRVYHRGKHDQDGKLVSVYYYKSKKDHEKKPFNKRLRKILTIWNKYGILGLSILTPLILSIPIGSFIAARFERDRVKLFTYMGVSILFWASLYVAIMYFLKIKF